MNFKSSRNIRAIINIWNLDFWFIKINHINMGNITSIGTEVASILDDYFLCKNFSLDGTSNTVMGPLKMMSFTIVPCEFYISGKIRKWAKDILWSELAATFITPKMYFFNTWKMILDKINKQDIAWECSISFMHCLIRNNYNWDNSKTRVFINIWFEIIISIGTFDNNMQQWIR